MEVVDNVRSTEDHFSALVGSCPEPKGEEETWIRNCAGSDQMGRSPTKNQVWEQGLAKSDTQVTDSAG